MKRDLGLSIVVTLAWAAGTIALDLLFRAWLPGIEVRTASLWIVLTASVVVAIAVTALRWWHEVGYTSPRYWRNTAWLAVPALATVVPLVAGVRPLDGQTYALLIAGYALTGFAEETMFRGVLVKLLERRSEWAIAGITALLFGLVHLSNVVIRGEVAIIAAQAVGAAAFGFGFAALRLRTNAIVPLIVLHMLHDLFLQMGQWPLIPVAVAQDVVLFAMGVILLRRKAG